MEPEVKVTGVPMIDQVLIEMEEAWSWQDQSSDMPVDLLDRVAWATETPGVKDPDREKFRADLLLEMKKYFNTRA